MRIVGLCVIFLFSINTFAQKVALVLSGGGAKGIAHVGVIKALEENNIPIDGIVGTSMGGIIGGCYASGMSAAEIEEMVISREFIRWVNGLPEAGYNYHYHQDGNDPHFIKLNLSLDSTLNFQFNTSIANDVSLNYAIAERMAQANAAANGNFDSLFVPLRVVAAEVFTQSQVILKDGELSDALRATQTVPFFYNPIRVNGRYLFDGGIYNNFPVDVAMNELKPDVVIGSNVSSKIFEKYPEKQDDKLIANSLLYMLLDKSDPSSIPDSGVYIQPNLKGYTSFDFGMARALIDSGYYQTLRQIDEIRQKVGATRVSAEELSKNREEFDSKKPELRFDNLAFKSFSTSQRKFIQQIFKVRQARSREFAIGDIRRSYYKLVSEPYFSNIYPNMLYDSSTGKFTLRLTRRPRKNFSVDFGGVIATRNVSNIALGLNYYYFNRALTHFQFKAQTGSFYKSIVAKARIDLPFYNSIYVEPEAAFNNWDYLESEDLIRSTSQTVLKRFDRKVGVNMGWPIGSQFKMSMGFSAFRNFDNYVNGETFVSTDTLDELRLRGIRASFSFSVDDLNRKQYPSAGKAYSITAGYYSVNEYYTPGNTSINAAAKQHHEWFRIRATAQHFFTNRGVFRVGYLADAVFSNQPFFSNYFGTIINAPGFAPFQDSPTLILENFRSFNYIAGGLRNVFAIRSRLDFRIEGYIFKPIIYIHEGQNQEALSDETLTTAYFAATAGFVLHSPVGPINFSVNYYDDKQNQWGAMLHVGFLLFNKHTIAE